MIEHTLRDFKLILANSKKTKQGGDIIRGQTLQEVFTPNNWGHIYEIHNYLNEAQAKTINDALHLGLGPFYRSNFFFPPPFFLQVVSTGLVHQPAVLYTHQTVPTNLFDPNE